jgi:hypothetical protein
MKYEIVEAFTLKKNVERLEFPLNKKSDYDLFDDKIFYWTSRNRKVKIVEDNYRKVLILLDDNGNDDLYYIFKAQKSTEEQRKSQKALMLCKKLVKSLDNGEYSNKALMNDILTNGVSKLRNFPNYEFNLPKLDSETNSYEDIDLQSLDLNNAYAQVLYSHGLISFQMHQMLVSAEKSVRLRVLGMLAKQQTITTYQSGKETQFQYSYKTKYYKLFQWAEVRVAYDMRYLRDILTDKFFVWLWVDGIYYRKDTPKKIVEEMQAYLNGEILPNVSYEYKFEAVPYLRHYKENKQYFLQLTKTNSHGVPEPKLYSLSRAWLKEESIEVI